MPMLCRLAAIGAATALVLVSARGAEAKLPSYVIAGGDLGSYAADFSALALVRDGGSPGWLPGESAQAVEPPKRLPSLAYDLYPSYGNFAVPYQLANGGPELRYYPDLRLLQRRAADADAWYALAPEAVAFLDAAIEEALAKKAAGELEEGPIAADFRARHLPDVGYWLVPFSTVATNEGYIAPSLSGCDECTILVGSREEWIMRHLVETVSQPLQGPASARPAFAIEYYGIVLPPSGGIGGLLGFYAPPIGDGAGRFWPGGYSTDAPYFETTAGFDAFVAEAASYASASPDAPPVGEQVQPASAATADGPAIWMMMTAAGALTAVVAATASVAANALSRRARRRIDE